MRTVEYKSYEERDKLIEEAKRQGFIVIGIGDKGNGTGHIDFGTEEEVKPDFDDLLESKLVILNAIFTQAIQKTDYIYLKALDLGIKAEQLYPDIVEYRKQLRKWKQDKELKIATAQNVEELEAINFDDIPQNPRESLTAK
jgi:hypothetical protein